MRSRRWGLIAVVALAIAAILLGFSLLQERGPGDRASTVPTTTSEMIVTPSPLSTATPAPAKPVTYTVQAGDTLSAIAQEHEVPLEALTAANDLADPDVLQIGQVLIIPQDERSTSSVLAVTEIPLPSSEAGERTLILPTMTPSAPPVVEISNVTGVGNVATEMVTLFNYGGVVNLEAWTLSGPADERFILPALTLFSEGEVRVHSIEGNDTPRDLYWGRTEPAWQEGELVSLRDADGNVVDTYIIPK